MWLFDWIYIIEDRNKILVYGNNLSYNAEKCNDLWFKQKSDLGK